MVESLVVLGVLVTKALSAPRPSPDQEDMNFYLYYFVVIISLTCTLWFGSIGLQISVSVSSYRHHEHLECSTIFTSHTLGHLVVRWAESTMVCIMHRVGTVDRRGYGSQQRGTVCDTRGPCPSIWRTLKPFFRWIWLIRCAYKLLRRIHLEIWRFLC